MVTYRFARAIAFAALACCANPSRAGEGDLDPGFSGDGMRIADFQYIGGYAQLAAERGGTVLVAGSRVVADSADFSVARLNASGGTSVGFGSVGVRTVSYPVAGGADYVHAVFALDDGSILLAGSVDTDPDVPGSVPNALLKLDAGGDVDTSFGNAGWAVLPDTPFAAFYTLSLDAARTRDGRIVFAGLCFDCGAADVSGLTVLRVSPQGTPDTTFGGDGWAVAMFPSDLQLNDVVVDAKGRVVVVASERVPDGFGSDTSVALLVRFTATGARDTSFGIDGTTRLEDLAPSNQYERFNALTAAADVDGTLLVSVRSSYRSGLVRLDDRGHVTPGFGAAGLANLWRENGTTTHDIVVRGDRRILAAGVIRRDAGLSDMVVARLLADGTPDDSFDSNGFKYIDTDSTQEDEARRMVLVAGRPVLAGPTGLNLRTTSLVRLQSDFVFADGVE